MPKATDKPARSLAAAGASTDPSSPAALRVARAAADAHGFAATTSDAPLTGRTPVEPHTPSIATPARDDTTEIGSPGALKPGPPPIDLDSSGADDVLLEGLLWRRPDRVVDKSTSAGAPAAVHHAVHELLAGDRTPTPQPKVLIARPLPDLDTTVRTPVVAHGGALGGLRRGSSDSAGGARRERSVRLLPLAGLLALGLVAVAVIFISAGGPANSPPPGPGAALVGGSMHSASPATSLTPPPLLTQALPASSENVPAAPRASVAPLPLTVQPPSMAQPPVPSHRPPTRPAPAQSRTAPAASHPPRPAPTSDDPDFLRE